MGLFTSSKDVKYAQFTAPQFLKIANDCANLVNSTTNPDVFFMRYDLLIDKMTELSRFERYVKFTGELPHITLYRISSQKDLIFTTFLRRSFDKLTNDINKLKTDKAKQNKINTYFTKINEYKSYLSPSHLDLLQYFEIECKQFIKDREREKNKNGADKTV